MAKTLITTFILWIALVTIALAQDLTKAAPRAASTTTAAPTTTTAAPTTTTAAPTTTTAAPTTASTTTAAPTTTTAAPTTTTAAPTTTTAAPTTASTTTAAPTTTTAAPTTASTTTAAPTTTTAAPTTSKATTSTKPSTSASSTATPPTESACDSSPCLDGSTCEERSNQTFACLCLAGQEYDYDSGNCQKAKVFPGQLILEKAYDPDMSNKTSKKFRDTATEIENEIDKVFDGKKEYRSSLVLELREKKESKVRAESGQVEASVQIFFERNSNINEEDVKTEIKNAAESCDDCILSGTTFQERDLCEDNPCDNSTTNCTFKDGTFKCPCQEKYVPTDFSDLICIACPDGKKPKGSECVSCGFGRTGLNCEDDHLFIAVIVSSVLGGIMIIALIALSVVASKSKKKGSKIKEEDFGKPYQSHSFAKPPPSYSNGQSASVKEPTNFSTTFEAPRIPRAISNWESKTNLEMTPSNSRQNLISSGRNTRFNENQDDMFSFSQGRPKNNTYEQIPPNSNPYAQNRATNPYTQNRGQTNPYYS